MGFLGTKPANAVMTAEQIANGTITLDKLAADAKFASGTKITFQQSSAPTGWTKITTNDNAALRVVSGSVATGGTVPFTTAFASQAVTGSNSATTSTGTIGATTLTSAQIPAHGHTFSGTTGGINANHVHGTSDGTYFAQTVAAGQTAGGSSYAAINSWTANTNTVSADHAHAYSGTTANAGSGGSHDHTFTGNSHNHTFTGNSIDLSVKYVDVIVATKD